MTISASDLHDSGARSGGAGNYGAAPAPRATAYRPRPRTVNHLRAVALLACAAFGSTAQAAIEVHVHAEFPASGFSSGPVFGTSGPESFDVTFHVDESAAQHYAAGFEVAPGRVYLAHDVYRFDRSAITGTSFSFGSQTFTEPYLHNLLFALLFDGIVAGYLFLSDITPGSHPFIEVGVLPVFLGSYEFGAFESSGLRSVSLNNNAVIFDGINQAFGTVSVTIVPLPAALPLLGLTLAVLGYRVRRR